MNILASMVEVLQSLVEIARLLFGLLVLAIPLTIAVMVFSRLEARLEKKFKLSWLKASWLSTFIAMFILLIFIYLLPFLQVLDFAKNDSLPAEIKTQFDEVNGVFVEQPTGSIPALDALISAVITIARLLLVAAVLALILLPLEFIGSAVFSRLERKKSANIPAFYIASFAGLLIAMIVIMVFSWIPAGIIYFIYFS
jgi:hypothetical protein